MPTRQSTLLPGATIGILGGGQLGRMTAMAARELGYHIRVLDPDASCAARFVVEECITAPFDDDIAAAWLAHRCDVVTLEIEKVSLASLDAAARLVPVRPSREALHIIQDRARQKRWLASKGFPMGPFRVAETEAELAKALVELGGRSFVKAATGGYDGRGQVEVADPSAAASAFRDLGSSTVVVERELSIEAELSVLVARRPSGESVVYPPALNHHENRILAWSAIPAPIEPKLAERAVELGRSIAEAMQIEGLLVIELFLVGGELLVNELAPRPHNSFHGTQIACATSQFEQHARAVCNLPLGSTQVLRPAAIANLLGDLWEGHSPPFDAALALPGVRLHLYGKRGARPGRKMGHLSAVGDTAEDAVRTVKLALERLGRRGA
jgi:5-(carboxyamino)imidazole ribonucleotide synthase